MRQSEIGNYGSFFALLHSPPLKTQKIRILKNCWRNHHFTHVNEKPQSYEVRFQRYRVSQTYFLSFFPFTHPPHPPNNPPNQDSEKMKKASGDVTILHICTKNHNHMRYSSWDTEWDRQFLSFWAIFFPFNPLTTHLIKILKKWKNHLEMSSFYIYVPKITIIWCMLAEIWKATDIFFCHFGPFFTLLLH